MPLQLVMLVLVVVVVDDADDDDDVAGEHHTWEPDLVRAAVRVTREIVLLTWLRIDLVCSPRLGRRARAGGNMYERMRLGAKKTPAESSGFSDSREPEAYIIGPDWGFWEWTNGPQEWEKEIVEFLSFPDPTPLYIGSS